MTEDAIHSRAEDYLLSDPADRVVSLLLPSCEPPPYMPRIMNSIITGHARATNA